MEIFGKRAGKSDDARPDTSTAGSNAVLHLPYNPRYAVCLFCAGQMATDFDRGAAAMIVSAAPGVSAIRWHLPVRPPRDAETGTRTANQSNYGRSGIERDRRASDPTARAVVATDECEGRLSLAAASISTFVKKRSIGEEPAKRIMASVAMCLAIAAAVPATAQDLPTDQLERHADTVRQGNLVRQTVGRQAYARSSGRSTPAQARACAKKGELRAQYGADNPKVQRLYNLCRSVGL